MEQEHHRRTYHGYPLSIGATLNRPRKTSLARRILGEKLPSCSAVG